MNAARGRTGKETTDSQVMKNIGMKQCASYPAASSGAARLTPRCLMRLSVVAAFFVLTSCLLWGLLSEAEAVEKTLRIGFSAKAFVNAPKEDMRVAVRILSEKVARKTIGSAESRIYESLSDIERDLKRGNLDAVALTPEDFLDLRGRAPFDPVLVTASEKGHEVEFLLLVRKDSRISDFAELRNRKIAIPMKIVQYGNMYSMWIETLLRRKGYHSPAEFFSSMREERNPSQAIMSLFFRQADACVVTSNAYDIASELNPQIGRDLRVLARLSRLAGGIVVFRRDLPDDLKHRLRQVLLTIHEDQEGRQLFVMFQLNRLIPYRPEYMTATEAFLTEYRKSGGKASRRR